MTEKEIKKEKNKKVNNVVITEKEMNSQIDLYDIKQDILKVMINKAVNNKLPKEDNKKILKFIERKLIEEEAEYKYIDFIKDIMTLIFDDNALAVYMPDCFFFGDVLDPELFGREEKKKEIKELLDNALKPYY